MIYNLNGQPFLPLDNYIDVDTFLTFKSKIAYLYATNTEKSIASWVAGGYNTGNEWANFSGDKKSLYHTYHEVIPTESEEIQNHVKQLELDSPYDKGNKLSTYFGIMYGTTPITVLHLTTGHDQLEWLDFVTSEYDDFKTWVTALPFSNITNVDVFYKPADVAPSIHRDYNLFPYMDGPGDVPDCLNRNLLLIRWVISDGFCMYDVDDHKNIAAEYDTKGCYALTFDDRNFHGKMDDHTPVWFYVKVEGTFTPEFKNKLNISN
jgi:hypothetical protein